jgi:hypothetical protein
MKEDSMDHARWERDLGRLETLGQVLRWTLAQTPRAEFVHVVVQDEYTHDVIVRIADDLFAAFDAT